MGLIVARISGGIDIREHGSGNIGLTNVIRTLGWGPGLASGLLDFLKGYIPVFIAMKTFNPEEFAGVAIIHETVIIMVAMALILGNMYPVYLLFKGGKGVATGLGVMSALMGVFIFIPLAVFGVVLMTLRFVSLASITAAIIIPLTNLLLYSKIPFVLSSGESTTARFMIVSFSWLTAGLIIWRHKSNIGRIIRNEEPRIRKLRESSESPPDAPESASLPVSESPAPGGADEDISDEPEVTVKYE